MLGVTRARLNFAVLSPVRLNAQTISRPGEGSRLPQLPNSMPMRTDQEVNDVADFWIGNAKSDLRQ